MKVMLGQRNLHQPHSRMFDDVGALFRRARACYEVAGESEGATRMQSELSHQTERLNEQYATLRLRLRVALDRDRYGEALEAARDLEGLLVRHADSPYRRWLGLLQRTLERKVT